MADATRQRAAVDYAVKMEKELVVDPNFFTLWATRSGGVAGIDIRLKRGRDHNEMTRHRYEVVLHQQPAGGPVPDVHGRGDRAGPVGVGADLHGE